MKIAIASHSELPGHAHFGHADTFHVYDIDNDPPQLVAVRRTAPHCGVEGADGARLAHSADLLLDCAAVLVADIGPCAADALAVRDIIPVTHAGPGLEGADAILQAIRDHVAGIAPARTLVEEPIL